ncbi:hypothetical protein BkAM31D_05010 [Halalkalibacter krulwichiae]|uniref:Uncharacterized protein n=1 Tax=Halalkalibacter krulwichiae TaxID=199441 RepID=A0A1X9M772_9BACI|nr:hypothetical protein BkAM31D_05010 [Halalkalibacter krulwichiae]
MEKDSGPEPESKCISQSLRKTIRMMGVHSTNFNLCGLSI